MSEIQTHGEALTPADLNKQVQLIQHVMKEVMKPGEHYGTIPGCGDKPALFKAGAEKLSMTFRMAPTYQVEKTELDGGHREYQVICSLSHITTGQVLGQGLGVCSTMESKYRFRKAARSCPQCGKEAIIKGKVEYGGGWICYKAKGGCNSKWADGAQEIEGQKVGSVEYENPADYYNTVIKMAKKRAHVDSVLTATAASDIFAQDIEDLPSEDAEPVQEKREESNAETKGEPAQKKFNPETQAAIDTQKSGDVITSHDAARISNFARSLGITDAQLLDYIGAHGFDLPESITTDKYESLREGLKTLNKNGKAA